MNSYSVMDVIPVSWMGVSVTCILCPSHNFLTHKENKFGESKKGRTGDAERERE